VKAISLYAPWVVAIVHHDKDIENRDWRTNFRGRILLHASREKSRAHTLREVSAVMSVLHRIHPRQPDEEALTLDTLTQLSIGFAGNIVAAITITGCATKSISPWWVGPYGFELSQPQLLPKPVPCKGQRHIWTVPSDAARAIREMA
jgi:hypothetical protein